MSAMTQRFNLGLLYLLTMVMTLISNNLASNKWYPLRNGKPLYPSPQSILRASVGAEEYKFISETVTTDHIRAAVIMPLDLPFQHLLNEPWAMCYKTNSWRMIIVSTLDPVRWIDVARASGCIAWLKNHAKTYTYQWEPPSLDAQGLKIRPPNSLGITSKQSALGLRSDAGAQRKDYNKAELLSDCRAGLMSHADIGIKHGISRITVLKIAKENGISRRKPHHGQSYG